MLSRKLQVCNISVQNAIIFFQSKVLLFFTNIVDQNIIGAPKRRNNFGSINFTNIVIAILDLPICSQSSYRSKSSLLHSSISLFKVITRNRKKKPLTNLQNQLKKGSKKINTDNCCYRKVGRAISKWRAIEKSLVYCYCNFQKNSYSKKYFAFLGHQLYFCRLYVLFSF